MKSLEQIRVIILSLILLCSVAFITIFIIGNKQNEVLNADLAEIHDEGYRDLAVEEAYTDSKGNSIDMLPGMKSLVDINPDTVGWIKIDGRSVDNVVVQSADNTYYLTHDFNGNYAEAGTIFLDQYCNINPTILCDNIILYGHNQLNGSMFGALIEYEKDPLIVAESPYIEFSNNYEDKTYIIYAMYVINTIEEQDSEPIFYYHMYSRFNDTYTYDDFAAQVAKRSMITSNIDVCENDTFLTLSTCASDFEDARFVIVARALRDDEDTDMKLLYELNDNAYFPEIWYN